jgi:hypothetical protein
MSCKILTSPCTKGGHPGSEFLKIKNANHTPTESAVSGSSLRVTRQEAALQHRLLTEMNMKKKPCCVHHPHTPSWVLGKATLALQSWNQSYYRAHQRHQKQNWDILSSHRVVPHEVQGICELFISERGLPWPHPRTTKPQSDTLKPPPTYRLWHSAHSLLRWFSHSWTLITSTWPIQPTLGSRCISFTFRKTVLTDNFWLCRYFHLILGL